MPHPRPDDDRPPRKKGGGVLLVVLLGGGVLLLTAVGLTIWLIFFLKPAAAPPSTETPQRAFDEFQDGAISRDYGKVYDRMDHETQMAVDGEMALAKNAPEMAPHKDKKGRDLFVAGMEESQKKGPNGGFSMDASKRMRVEKVEENGDEATLTVRRADGEMTTWEMVKQEGTWRIRWLIRLLKGEGAGGGQVGGIGGPRD